jgi:hypothetical protein
MKGWVLLLALGGMQARADSNAVLRVEYSNPGLTPSRWTLELHPDGSAHFHSDPGAKTATELHTIEPGPVDRDIRLGRDFTDHAFRIVRHHNLLNEECESHLKVAFQGLKKIMYSGPEGNGGCEFNFSKNKEIQELGDDFVGVASTVVEGARLELLLQHDPLGLDKEMEFMKEASDDGRLQQIGAIQPILAKLADDTDVMERVRRQARMLLAETERQGIGNRE